MKPRIQHLEWDSNLFGYQVYKIDGYTDKKTSEELLSAAMAKGANVVYWFSDQEMNFDDKYESILADIKIDYSRPTDPQHKVNEKIKKVSHDINFSNLLTLALASGEYSRFKVDPNFVNAEFQTLYRLWLERSLNGEIADEILVYIDEKKLQGFVTLSFYQKDDFVRIGLIAVDEMSRGLNIGRKLLEAVSAKGVEKGLGQVKVFTQKANQAACVFYEKCGFVLTSMIYIYHIWFNKDANSI